MNNLFRSTTRTSVLGFLFLEFFCGSLMTQSLVSTLLHSSLYASPGSPRAIVRKLDNVSGVRPFSSPGLAKFTLGQGHYFLPRCFQPHCLSYMRLRAKSSAQSIYRRTFGSLNLKSEVASQKNTSTVLIPRKSRRSFRAAQRPPR